MERLTHDNPQGNFETMLNYVFGKDGYAYIRSDGESDEPVLLTDWARKQCAARHCTAPDGTSEEIDQAICDCAMFSPDCPVFLAYTFACQAVHMRDRCKAYEDAIPFADLPRAAELLKAESPHPDGDTSILSCPRCGSGEYLHNEDGSQNAFCGQCGKKIDWSAETEPVLRGEKHG